MGKSGKSGLNDFTLRAGTGWCCTERSKIGPDWDLGGGEEMDAKNQQIYKCNGLIIYLKKWNPNKILLFNIMLCACVYVWRIKFTPTWNQKVGLNFEIENDV